MIPAPKTPAPDDASSISGDFVQPVVRDDWARQVNDARIRTTDRLRPFVTRGLLQMAMLVVLLLMPDVSRWAWVLWLPGAIQTVLELVLERMVRGPATTGAVRGPLAGMVGIWYENYERRFLNATGLIGVVAVPSSLAMATLATGPDNPPALKVLLFVLVLLADMSAVLGTLMDTYWFSPLVDGSVSRVLRRAHPFLWVIAILVPTAFVLIGEAFGRWPDGALPFALMACVLPYYIGLRIREYSRDLRTTEQVMRTVMRRKYEPLSGLETHDLLQPIKYTLPHAIDTADLTPYQRSELYALLEDLKRVLYEARHGRLTMRDTASRVLDGSGIRLTVDFADIELDDDNQRLATRLLANLLNNAKQAYEADPFIVGPHIVVTMRTDGRMVEVAVTDELAPIPAEHFARAGSTLARLRGLVRDRDGDLTQLVRSQGKTIAAHWQVTVRPLRAASQTEEAP